MAVWAPPRGGSLARRDPTSPWRHVDWALVVSTLLVAGLGAVMVLPEEVSLIAPPLRAHGAEGIFLVVS